MVDAIFAVLLALHASVWDADEQKEAREARLKQLARVIDVVSETELDRALLLTNGEAESQFAGYVGAGCQSVPKGAPNCDGGTSRSYWQMKLRACPRGWAHPRGSLAAQVEFARCSLQQVKGHAQRCAGKHPAGYWAGGFSGYRSGGVCTEAEGARRAALLQRRLYLLQQKRQSD